MSKSYLEEGRDVPQIPRRERMQLIADRGLLAGEGVLQVNFHQADEVLMMGP